MNKVKILSFASLPLAMALLAGCGHEHSFPSEWKHDDNQHWHECECGEKEGVGNHIDEDKDNKCDACGFDLPQPAPEIDYTVTKEEWNASFHTEKKFYFADNYKASMVMVKGDLSSGQYGYIDGNKLKMEAFEKQGETVLGSDEQYFEALADGSITLYRLESDKKWHAQPNSSNPMTYFAEHFAPYSYDKFEYDEASHLYKCASGQNPVFGEVTNLTIKFENKMVVSFSFDLKMPNGGGVLEDYSMIGEIVYGGQKVDLPQVEEHNHSFSIKNWDADNHWMECECGQRDESSVQAHFDSNSDGFCDGCNFAMPVHEHDFSITNNDSVHHWVECACGSVFEPSYDTHYDNNADGFCDFCDYEMGVSPIPELPIYGLDYDGSIKNMSYNSELEQYELLNVSLIANQEVIVKNVTPGSEGVLTNLQIGGEAHGFAVSQGILTPSEEGTYSFYLKPNFGYDVIYIAAYVPPVPGEPVYAYKLNSELYNEMIFQEKNGQWEVYDIEMSAGDTLTIANVGGGLPKPEVLTSLAIGGETQGFSILNGVLTASKDGIFSFYLCPEFGNDKIYIADNSSPIPETVIKVMGIDNDWENGADMSPVSEGSTEYARHNIAINAGDKLKVRIDDDFWISDYKINIGEANAIDDHVAGIDEDGNVEFYFGGVYSIYFETAEGDNYGVFVKRESVTCPYIGQADGIKPVTPYEEVHEEHSFIFNKVDVSNNFIEYCLLDFQSFNGLAYNVRNGDNQVDFILEEGGEGANFEKVDSVITYRGTATKLNFYLKEDLSEHTLKIYVENPNQKSNFQMLVGSEAVNLTLNEFPMEGFIEYFVTGLTVNEGDVIRFIDNTQTPAVTFDITKIDSASVSGFTVENNSIKCTATGIYDFYLKLQMNNDQIYIGEAAK